MKNSEKKKKVKRTTFQVTDNQKQFTVNTAASMEIPEAALIRGLIRFHKEKGK